MRPSGALSHLSQLARLGLPSRTIIPEMLTTLARLVPSHFCMFVWIDSRGRPVDFHLPWINAQAIEANSSLLTCYDMEVPSFTSLVRGGRPYGFAAEACRKPDFASSFFYNEVCRPYGVGHGFDVFVRDGRAVRGVVLATREPGKSYYSRRDVEALMGAAPAFAHALAADNLDLPASTAFADDAERAVLTLDGDGHIVEASGRHEQLLRALLDLRFDQRFSRTAFVSAAPDFFAPLLARAARQPTVVRMTPYGRIVIRFYPVTRPAGAAGPGARQPDSDQFYALIERQVPLALAAMNRLAAFDLSPREREVARHMIAAEPPQRIMQAMGIGSHTLHDYRRRIYRRIGVGSREELAQRVMQ